MRRFKKHLVPCPKTEALPACFYKQALELEIGSGKGRHAIMRARQNPDKKIIAIEKTRTRFRKFQNLIKDCSIDNLIGVHTNAIWWLSHHGKMDMFERIFILYPCPYPRKKQKNLRWIHRPFWPYLISLLKTGGVLELRTNKKFYYDDFKCQLEKFKNLKIKQEKEIDSTENPITEFEEKYLNNKEICYKIQIEKLTDCKLS